MNTLPRVCCTCAETKPLDEFYRDRGGKDGREARCKTCRRKSVKESYGKHKEARNKNSAEWGFKNRAKCKIYERSYYQRNKERKAAAVLSWQINNIGRFRKLQRETIRRLRVLYPARYRAYGAKNRAARMLRCPPWVDKAALAKIYRDCPKGMVVDHIVPLQGKNVSGLHVPWNLQYLWPFENGSKGNKF